MNRHYPEGDDCCWECAAEGELEEATIFDTSGGAYLQLCRWCRGAFERRDNIYQPTVCVRCSRHRNPSRADGLQFFGTSKESESLHICDACRVDLLGMSSNRSGRRSATERCEP
jgi:hypothetical protein